MLPEAFSERMRRMLGGEYGAFLNTFEEEPCQALRLNALKLDGAGKSAAEVYGGRGGQAVKTCFGCLTPVPWAENGYYYGAEDRPGRHPCHEAGVYYIQEPSAMLPAKLLEARPGEKVLDLCAAPGGKTTQLAAKMKGKGFLLCNEIHPGRARILSENVERMGIRNACVTNETPAGLAEHLPEFFHRILVDAPCSGEGMFRKNQEACGEWSPKNVRLCAERQDGILDQAARLLQPGGRLVYSTCTFSEEENEGCVDRFLGRHPEFHAVRLSGEDMGLPGCEGGREGTVRLWPHRVRGEGHFAAVLEKEGDFASGERSDFHGGRGASGARCLPRPPVFGEREIPLNELGEYLCFCRENLREEGKRAWGGHYIRFGDNLYLAPEEMPKLKGLKVLRPGLHLGELKKNRFEPSHALAHALSPREAKHVWNLGRSDGTAALYLNGGTFPARGEKGWYLICFDGFSLGWGKLAGGVMKNHYPRGLRLC